MQYYVVFSFYCYIMLFNWYYHLIYLLYFIMPINYRKLIIVNQFLAKNAINTIEQEDHVLLLNRIQQEADPTGGGSTDKGSRSLLTSLCMVMINLFINIIRILINFIILNFFETFIRHVSIVKLYWNYIFSFSILYKIVFRLVTSLMTLD